MSMRGGGARAWAADERGGCLAGIAGTPREERAGREGGGIRDEDCEARCAELGAGNEGGGMRDEGAVGGLVEGVVCGLDETFGGGGIDFEFFAGREGAVSGGDSSEKEGAGAAFDESSEKEGTAVEGAAGVACGVF